MCEQSEDRKYGESVHPRQHSLFMFLYKEKSFNISNVSKFDYLTFLKALISIILVTNIIKASIIENPANITKAFLTENEKM